MADLRLYRKKRDPDRTPEPFGDLSGGAAPRALPPDARRRFVVQQHDASRMHWDLRLEIEGVLVSWAVPRGPSLDPAEKRLAVQTEDHPLEYGDFEGVIPEGNYGAGAMIVWDHGVYRSVDGRTPAEGLAAGKLDLLLEGSKLRGRFALVRTARDGERDWLLFKKGATPPEDRELVEAQPASVFSGLTVDELEAGTRRDEAVAAAAEAAGARRAELDAARLRPMLADVRKTAFSDPAWLFELKYDGVRLLAEKRGDAVRLFSRLGRDRTAVYPEIATALRHLPLDDALLDGEVVALDASGRASFGDLTRRFTQTDAAAIARGVVEVPTVFYAFDLLGAAGFDLRALSLVERKGLLARCVPPIGTLRFADHVEGDGEVLFAAATEHGLEGVVAKRSDAPYEDGRRSKRWLKIKVPRSAALAIVGISPGQGSRRSLGSVMLAGWRDGELCYVGNAGSGLRDGHIDEILADAERLQRATPAMRDGPERPPDGTRYLEPELVCEAGYTDLTSNGTLRHPVFRRLLPDVSLAECAAPGARPAAEPDLPTPDPPAQGEELQLTRQDKVFWPASGYTKGDLLAYYEGVWPWIAPYLRDRPVVLTRYPDGIEGKHFYQKNAPSFTPAWVQRETIDGTDYFVCNELRTLLYVVNSGAIPLHVWSSRITDLEHPDWCIVDLDPKEAPFADVVAIARELHRQLEALDVCHFVKTSGQDGLHILLPLGGQLTHKESRTLAEVLARRVVAALPGIATVTRPAASRGGKVYVDYGQNARGQLIASPLSVRPRPGAPVSMPLTWPQVTRRLDPTRWNLRTARKRLEKSGDPLRRVLEASIDVPALLSAIEERASEP